MRGCILEILAAAVLVAFVVGCSRTPTIRPSYQQVVGQVTSGKLAPDEYGVIRLPAELSSTSVDGKVYVSKSTSGSLLILFRTWRGKGSNLQGYLYCSAPLSAADTQKDYYGRTVIDLNGPVIHGPPGTTPISRFECVLDKAIASNWYLVHYDLD